MSTVLTVIEFFFVRFGLSAVFAVSIGAASIIVIRILATVFKWNMPKTIDFKKLEEKNK